MRAALRQYLAGRYRNVDHFRQMTHHTAARTWRADVFFYFSGPAAEDERRKRGRIAFLPARNPNAVLTLDLHSYWVSSFTKRPSTDARRS